MKCYQWLWNLFRTWDSYTPKCKNVNNIIWWYTHNNGSENSRTCTMEHQATKILISLFTLLLSSTTEPSLRAKLPLNHYFFLRKVREEEKKKRRGRRHHSGKQGSRKRYKIMLRFFFYLYMYVCVHVSEFMCAICTQESKWTRQGQEMP